MSTHGTDTEGTMATTIYTAVFPKMAQATAFAARIEEPGWKAELVAQRGRTVEFEGPDTAEYRMDIAETVGYFGSPPQGKVATLNGRPTPRCW